MKARLVVRVIFETLLIVALAVGVAYLWATILLDQQ